MSDFIANLSGRPFKIQVLADAYPSETFLRRQAALQAALSHVELDSNEEQVIDMALVFEYYLEHGEYPS